VEVQMRRSGILHPTDGDNETAGAPLGAPAFLFGVVYGSQDLLCFDDDFDFFSLLKIKYNTLNIENNQKI
jgi:hypothetical protein